MSQYRSVGCTVLITTRYDDNPDTDMKEYTFTIETAKQYAAMIGAEFEEAQQGDIGCKHERP